MALNAVKGQHWKTFTGQQKLQQVNRQYSHVRHPLAKNKTRVACCVCDIIMLCL